MRVFFIAINTISGMHWHKYERIFVNMVRKETVIQHSRSSYALLEILKGVMIFGRSIRWNKSVGFDAGAGRAAVYDDIRRFRRGSSEGRGTRGQ